METNEIIVHHATENNLKNVSIRIPKHQITVFTGVSGSGKSSLVLDTLAVAESAVDGWNLYGYLYPSEAFIFQSGTAFCRLFGQLFIQSSTGMLPAV